MIDRSPALPKSMSEPATEPAADPPVGDGALERLTLRLTGVMRRHYERSAAAHGLTPPQATALRNLGDPVPMRELADRLRCDASYVTALADALEANGWAERRPHPDDRRVRRLALTPAGRTKTDAFLRTLIDDSPLVRALGPEERSSFGAMLERIVAADAERSDAANGRCPPPDCSSG